MATELLITEWVPMQMWLLYNKYNLFYFLPKPVWFRFSLPQYYLCLKIKLSLNDWFAIFTKIRKTCSTKLSKWIANRVSQTVNSNPDMSLSYRNQSTDLRGKSIDWFLYEMDIGCQRVKILVIKHTSQPAITCSKLTTETLEQGVKYVQS